MVEHLAKAMGLIVESTVAPLTGDAIDPAAAGTQPAAAQMLLGRIERRRHEFQV
jgi:hypothetical protein